MQLSIIIPVYNESENVRPLAEEVGSALEDLAVPWECLWIDDGSTDGTAAELERIHREDPRHGYVLHRENYGQSYALATGFRLARGSYIGTLDGDGQNDPKDLPVLLSRLLREGADLVNGVRTKRKDGWVRRISSKVGNGFRNRITRESVSDVGCSIRVFRRECVENLFVFRGMHRFFPTLIGLAGKWKILEALVNHRFRRGGKTKYGIRNRLWTGLVDTLFVRWMQLRTVYPEYTAPCHETEPKERDAHVRDGLDHPRLYCPGDVLPQVFRSVDSERKSG